MMSEEHSVLLIDKPQGITSFDVIRRLRRELGVRKMGHAGTLDPLASGLMLVGVGEGTKRLAEYLKLDKEYEAEIILGERRSTGDLEGEVLEECAVGEVSAEELAEALVGMISTLTLPVPAYSAVKQGGRALYKRARRGEEMELPEKEMRVLAAALERIERRGDRVHVFATLRVGSGAYIRSLTEELGRRLGYPATLGNLRRTQVGEFRVKNARTV